METRGIEGHVVSPKGWSDAPGPPYSPGIAAGGLLYISGQLPIDPRTREVVPGDVQTQTRRVLENVCAVLAEVGSTIDDLIQVRVYLLRRSDWGAMNEVYREVVGTPPPARCVVIVPEMAPGASVEIEAIALVHELASKSSNLC